jgi:uncharacterized membrane protein
MKNKNVGFLVCGIAVVIIAIVLIFNVGMRDIVSQTCTHGPDCSMYDTIALQTGISLSIAGLVLILGLFLIFAKPEERIIVKKIKKKKINLSKLNEDEKKVIKSLQREKGGMFQRSLMEELEWGKVKITRTLDKLESKGLVERKRRGMNNIVVLIQ